PIVMACLMSLVMLFYIALFALVGVTEGTKTDLKNTVNKQVTAIQENNLDKAYSYESSDAMSADDFNEFVKQHPEFSQSSSVKFPQSDYNDVDKQSAKLEAQLVSSGGEKTTVHY